MLRGIGGWCGRPMWGGLSPRHDRPLLESQPGRPFPPLPSPFQKSVHCRVKAVSGMFIQMFVTLANKDLPHRSPITVTKTIHLE